MTQLIETYRGFVYPWQMDHIGHLNVQFYVGKFDEASWHVLATFSITPSYLQDNNRRVVAAEQNIKYQQEVRSGSLLVIKSIVEEVKSRVIKYKHIMYNDESKEQVAEMRLTVIHIDTEARESSDFPPEIFDKLLKAI